jgi:methionyl-tRNA synthetase
MAKDNIPFHTIGFPATIIGSGEPWKQVDFIKGVNWMTYYGGKFSTSQQRGVFMDHALELLPADYWRYYLVANAPESDDADFTWEGFRQVVNTALADTLGNFVNRCLSLVANKFGPAIPAGGAASEAENALAAKLEPQVAAYNQHLSDLQFRKLAQQMRDMWSTGNAYLDRMAPWKTIKTDRGRAACVLRTAVNLVRIYAILAWPIMPATSEKLYGALGLGAQEKRWISGNVQAELALLEAGRPFTVPEILFRKIQDEDVEGWKDRFGAGVETP